MCRTFSCILAYETEISRVETLLTLSAMVARLNVTIPSRVLLSK